MAGSIQQRILRERHHQLKPVAGGITGKSVTTQIG
jgi:hypothetical protein